MMKMRWSLIGFEGSTRPDGLREKETAEFINNVDGQLLYIPITYKKEDKIKLDAVKRCFTEHMKLMKIAEANQMGGLQ